MNEQNDFERLVADQLSNAAVGAPPETAIQDTIARAGGTRRSPEWLALIKESPMRTNNHLAVGSPTVRVATIVVATMLLALSLAAAGIAGQRLLAANGPIVVAQDGSGTVETITEAVAMAEDGDEILVRPGTYVEAVVVEKDISLKGDGERGEIVVQAPADGPQWDTKFPWIGEKPYAIVLTAPEGSVSDLTLDGEDSRLFVDGGRASISGVSFDEVGMPPVGPGTPVARALIVTGGAVAEVNGNDFVGGNGVNVFDSAVALIEDNHFVLGGIYGDYGHGTRIINNTFSGAAPMAIRFGEPAEVLVEGNDISDRDVAINALNGLGPAVIKDNTISGAQSTAISATGSTGQVIDNVITDSTLAITWSGDGGLVANNTISGGATGIIVGSGTSTVEGNSVVDATNKGMTIYASAITELSGNTLCGNEIDLDIAEGATVTDDGTNEICEDAPAE